MSFVSCSTWVKRGLAKSRPDKVELTSQEIKDILEAQNRERAVDNAENPSNNEDEYNFDAYDEEPDSAQLLLGLNNVTTFDSEEGGGDAEESDSEKEDEIISDSDNLIVVGVSEKDSDILKVYVYNESDNDLFVHHDIILSTCPLCVTCLNDSESSESGNFVAVGGMAPVIEVWDLDLINPVEPVCKLGFRSSKKKYAHRNYGHKDAVLDMSWNRELQHILASSSVDKSIILWDLDNKKPSTVISVFGGNVESIEWHPQEGQTLLAGSEDGTVKIFDCRYDSTFKSWDVDGEALCVSWNPWDPFSALVGTSTGRIYSIDSRADTPVWSTDACGEDITGLGAVSACDGLLLSSYHDGIVRVWDIRGVPELVGANDAKIGQIHSLSLSPDSPNIFVVGGQREKGKNFRLVNLKEYKEVTDKWTFP